MPNLLVLSPLPLPLQVHRSPGFITSNLIGKNHETGELIKEYEASHGTVADLWQVGVQAARQRQLCLSLSLSPPLSRSHREA